MGCIPIFGYKKPDVDNSPILGAHILFMGCLPLGFQKKMVDEFFGFIVAKLDSNGLFFNLSFWRRVGWSLDGFLFTTLFLGLDLPK